MEPSTLFTHSDTAGVRGAVPCIAGFQTAVVVFPALVDQVEEGGAERVLVLQLLPDGGGHGPASLPAPDLDPGQVADRSRE